MMPKSTATMLPVLVDEEIAGMHVGVEEAVAHGVAEEGLHQPRAELFQIVALRRERVAIGDRGAVDPFKRQDPARAPAPIDHRHAEALVVLRVLRHLRDGGGLHAEIHLDGDGFRQGLDHGLRPEPARRRVKALDQLGGEEIGIEVLVEALLDAGPEHLDGDRLEPAVALAHGGLVHLGDRGRGDGRPELGEDRVERRLERLFHRIARLGLGERRQPVLKRRQVSCELAPDDVVAGGEELAELDVGRPERGERRRQPRLIRRGLAVRLPPERRRHAAEDAKRRRQPDLVGQHPGAGPGDDGAGPRQPCHIGDRVHALITASRNGSPRCRR